MRSIFARAALAATALFAAVAIPAESAQAQKALVYCPVGIDDTGCNAIVNGLGAQYLGGVDRAYDGSGGTIDLATADLGGYAVFVIPSLADDQAAAPYARLRDPSIAHRLHDVLIGRIALWSGTPDVGSSNRAAKDALIASLANWAGGNYSNVNGPGLVALQDQSANTTSRYDWLQGLVSLRVVADSAPNVYASVTTQDAVGAAILGSGGTQLAYSNMASYGFYLPVGAAGISISALGQTGTQVGGQVVLLTSNGGDVGTAVVRTDKDDYAPGEIVTITGSGFKPGETVTITLHEDPWFDDHPTLTATADGSGNWTNTQFSPDDHDINIRFILTALGDLGSRAQTTFTDAELVTSELSGTVNDVTVAKGSSAGFTISVSATGAIGCAITSGTPATATIHTSYSLSAAGVLSSSTPSAALNFFSDGVGGPTNCGTTWTGAPTAYSVAATISANASTPVGTYTITLSTSAGTVAVTNPAVAGGKLADATATSIVVHVVAPPNTAPILGAIGNQSVNEGSLLTFTATANDAESPPQSLTFSLDPGAPSGASINSSSGAFTWTPTEAQGPGSYPIAVRVSDSGSPSLSDFETITVTVNEVNVAPTVNAVADQVVNEGATLGFTATGADTDIPANTLTWSLVGAPAGMTINSSSGDVSWTPGEADGPNTYNFMVRLTDNGSPVLFGEANVKVTVNEVNAAPQLLNVPASATIPELSPYSFDADATDSDIPAQTLTFTLSSAPAGATIDPSTGVFSWTPSEAQGPGSYTFSVQVGDGVTTTSQSVTLAVSEINAAPTVNAIADQVTNEEAAFTFTPSGNDADLPANTLTWSLVGAPAGMTIDPSTGKIDWTPDESQGPNTYTVTVQLTDNGTPPLSASTTMKVTVNEVNVAPVLDPVGNKAVDEETLLSFTATATDHDLPANTLTFTLGAGAPAGAAITTGGAFTWTPTEAQGPGDYPVTIRVTDNGTGNLFDEETITIHVNETNKAPTLSNVPASATIPELASYGFDANAADADLPAQTLTFSLTGAPSGATIDPSTGVFAWTPTEAQGPGSYTFDVVVSDGVTSTSQSVTLTVDEVNSAPILSAIGNQAVDEETQLTFTATATDNDLPANTLTFTLEGTVPAGAGITTGGVFTWTPTEAQGPGDYAITVRVTDNGTGSLFDEETINVHVNEVNVAPVLNAIGNKTVDEEANLSFMATASDHDLPTQTLSFSLANPSSGNFPTGATISLTGAFNWTPNESQGPGTYRVKVQVSDGVVSTEEEIQITVNEVNKAPTVNAIADQTSNEEVAFTLTPAGSDPDIPANTLTWSLNGQPSGMTIDPVTGKIDWTPNESHGPGTYTFNVRLTDNGSPSLYGETSMKVTVNEVNVAPVLDAVGDKTVDEETLLTFTATASDHDIPANLLTFTLQGTVPAGADITTAGVFTWTPTEAQGPGDFPVTIRVTDNGTGALFDEETINIHVNEVNVAPVLGAIGNKTVNEETQLTFTAAATDQDLPANALTYSLIGAPLGASIDPTTGVFTWTPTEAQGPGDYPVTIRVTDNGTGNLFDEETINIHVNEVNVAPVLDPVGNRSVNESSLLTFTASASDRDVPAGILTFSLDAGAPAGAAIDPSTGVFTWTPNDGPSQSTSITIRVKDNGTPQLDAFETITVTVKNVEPTAAFSASSPVNEGSPIALALTGATDVSSVDHAAGFTYAFDCGAGYSAASGTATASCATTDNGTRTVKGKVIDKDGGFTEYSEIVTINNVAPDISTLNVPTAPIAAGSPINVTWAFTDPGADTWTCSTDWDNLAGFVSASYVSTKSCSATTTLPAGIYTVKVRVTDDDGGPDTETATTYIVVYDPKNGFVTGGGWINSPAGALASNASLTGKANFGFVSQYKKGASVPTGETEFQFQVGNLNFHSTTYEWLVVSGSCKAQYKGSGTINGSGDYGFILTTIDGQAASSCGGQDKFRIKIFNKTTNAVIYDNQLGSTDTDAPTTAISGGSIVIH